MHHDTNDGKIRLKIIILLHTHKQHRQEFGVKILGRQETTEEEREREGLDTHFLEREERELLWDSFLGFD